MKNLNQKNILPASVSMLMTLAICQSVSVHASDIEIYSHATGGETRIMFVLDTSQSMSTAYNAGKPMACDAPSGAIVNSYSNTTVSASTVNGVEIPAYLRYSCNVSTPTSNFTTTLYRCGTSNTATTTKASCTNNTTLASAPTTGNGIACNESSTSGNTTTTYYYDRGGCNGITGTARYRYRKVVVPANANVDVYDRITKLKEGLFDVLIGRNGVARLGDDVIVGLTRFGTTNATVLSPARRLDSSTSNCSGKNQRSCLVQQIAQMNADGYTPTGVAYAVGAKSLLDTIGTNPSSCDGNGMYVLTDGGPSATGLVSESTTTNAMKNTISGFSCPAAWNVDTTNTNPTFQFKSWTPPASGTSYNNQHVWRCIAKFSDTLLKGATGRAQIKTATVGFGNFYEGLDDYTNAEKGKSVTLPLAEDNIDIQNILGRFNNITNNWAGTQGGSSRADIANTALWGVYGRGGWYAASEPAQVADSILNFVSLVKPEFDPIATGSPTLPQDALNPLRIQPFGYYTSFVPKPQESTQLWAGNMNKYHIHRGALYDSGKSKPLIKTDGSLDSTVNGIWTGGVKGQLPLGIDTNLADEKVEKRILFTNRQITGTVAPYAANATNSLKQVSLGTLFGTDPDTALFLNDEKKNYWLNLLGYDVGATETGITLENLVNKPELRQVGAIMHSTPILLTQSGKIIAGSDGELDTSDRKDYLLFGSTQGLLHVVDKNGKEVFAFAPHEMMENYPGAFLSENSTAGGVNNLFYGVDAPWTAHTQYVAKSDNTLTVKDSGRTVKETDDGEAIALKGLQWVYGGLRMGGNSYYALDLSDLDTPRLKFHIDPVNAKIYKSSTTVTNVTALSHMGQSWSKPTIAYVNFGGEKKLVMFVGGGYDAGYENAAYNQENRKGAGVYMFDANTGDLLWWTSANATVAGGAEAYTNASANDINMKYSVVSQINAIDRDNDGLVDHLYFGDLGGQAFRVDLNNNATGNNASTKKSNFAKRVVRLFSEHATSSASPRFYEMPSFSVHDGDNGYVAAVAFSSGNRSSPLSGAAATSGRNNQAGSTTSAVDGVFVVYDKDVAKADLYGTPTLTAPTSLTSLNANISTGVAVAGNYGWKYTYSNTAGAYKGMNELYALDGMLYVNVYHRDGAGIGGSCGAGVKGDSYIYQFCLPTGKCPFETTTSGIPNSVKVGAGIIGSGLGQSVGGNLSELILTRPDTLDCRATPNKPECQKFSTTAKIRQLRWYETR
ncbi:pilus assembly protein [Acinetobacter haemolyticus]|uniref:pilus assembly protein n=1 Tax=Acinetobacter haemolyticus TaxID=29430 RepID=UPI0002E5CEED|nr:PilC/PilY family type IV pilus protein [Acinetobacter haemolyticus]